MALRYLIDTDTCIYLRQRRPENVLKQFARLKVGEAAISVVTYGELFYGVEKNAHSSVSFERLTELTAFLPVLPLTFETAKAYGSIRADLDRGACARRGAHAGNEQSEGVSARARTEAAELGDRRLIRNAAQCVVRTAK